MKPIEEQLPRRPIRVRFRYLQLERLDVGRERSVRLIAFWIDFGLVWSAWTTMAVQK